jgi:hypothetical protein
MTPHEALKILGLTISASEEEIKQAYRDRVKVWHPDRFPNDPRLRAQAQEETRRTIEAYQALDGYRPPLRSSSEAQAPPPPASSQSSPHDHDPGRGGVGAVTKKYALLGLALLAVAYWIYSTHAAKVREEQARSRICADFYRESDACIDRREREACLTVDRMRAAKVSYTWCLMGKEMDPDAAALWQKQMNSVGVH